MRAREHGIPLDQVLACLHDPEQTYSVPNDGTVRRIHQRSGCAIVVEPDNRVVVTVLPRITERWLHDGTRNQGVRLPAHPLSARPLSVDGSAVSGVARSQKRR